MMLRLFALAAISFFSFCNNAAVDPTDEAFQQARAKWAKVSTGNYSFVFQYDCYCLPAFYGPFKIWVKNEAIDSMYNKNTDSAVPDSLYKKYMSISKAFNWIDSIRSTKPKVDTVAYDNYLGFPKFANFDWEPVGTDGSIGILIDSVVFE